LQRVSLPPTPLQDFNSTIVQLTRLFAQLSQEPPCDFNSTIVQLTPAAIQPNTVQLTHKYVIQGSGLYEDFNSTIVQLTLVTRPINTLTSEVLPSIRKTFQFYNSPINTNSPKGDRLVVP
ncbi:MAG: hypothetical protein EZS28_019989, partial [Streblomastix strix]